MAKEVGLSLNAAKCVALSMVPSGRDKKYKIITKDQFHLRDGSSVVQLKPSQEWRYLGVDFRPIGPKRVGGTLAIELERLTKAPLKPQQRLLILRAFLLPRLYHKLVLAGSTLGKLRALDMQVRLAVRKWLHLPHDIPKAYFHTPAPNGGLGLPSFETTVPCLMRERLSNLAESSLPAARAAHEGYWVSKRILWSDRALTKANGVTLASSKEAVRWWSQALYSSVDGFELRECGKTNISSSWVYGGMALSGRDYVQYHHVRINALPTRIRTSRGIRRQTTDVQCRAGCRVTETAAHVIQACHRTHGGRILRHDAACKIVASGLRDKRWVVEVEPHFRTAQGLRKPDIVTNKGNIVCVLDTQVVSGATSLDDAHERKCAYYSGNEDIKSSLATKHNVRTTDIKFLSCTLSWRGVWSSKSAELLRGMGLSKKLLGFITCRVLRGSHMNWTRWNKMTTTTRQYHQPRVGVG